MEQEGSNSHKGSRLVFTYAEPKEMAQAKLEAIQHRVHEKLQARVDRQQSELGGLERQQSASTPGKEARGILL